MVKSFVKMVLLVTRFRDWPCKIKGVIEEKAVGEGCNVG